MSTVSRAGYAIGAIATVFIAWKVTPVVWHSVGPFEAIVVFAGVLHLALAMLDRAISGRVDA